jgi:hypothetical protein
MMPITHHESLSIDTICLKNGELRLVAVAFHRASREMQVIKMK